MQPSQYLGMISKDNSQAGLEQSTESPRGCPPPLSKPQTDKNQRIEALKDLTRLLELVTEQEIQGETVTS